VPPENLPGAALTLRGLRKTYPGQTAVDEVDLDVRSGEFLTFLGPSGSGKTTTLNMVAGFVAPTAGSITMDGQDLLALPPHRRGIGMVFQNYALFPHMTVFENIAFPLKQRKYSRDRIRTEVASALEQVSLGGFGDRLPKQLSGGQQQRVAVARALVFQPRLLLMDEPLGALDKNLRESLQAEIRRLHRELGITFLYVTHDQEEAIALSDRVAVFDRGRIQQIGTPDELYDRPATRFVASFLGEANIASGEAEGERDGTVAVKVDGGVLRAPGSAAAGASVCVVTRPERIRLEQRRGAAGLNRVSGPIVDLAYLGSSVRLRVEHAPGHSTVMRAPAGTLPPCAVGDTVTLAWDPRDSVLLPDSPSSTTPHPTKGMPS